MRGCLSFGASLLILSACPGDAEQGQRVTCVDGDARCGMSCSDADPCEAGLYCTGAGLCAKQCVAADEDACSGGAQCGDNGKCAAPNSGGAGTGGSGGGAGMGASGGGASAGKGGACAETVVTTQRVQPTVILIVDQSSSMDQKFPEGGANSRWEVLKRSLLAEDGLIKDLQSQVRFGLALYSADSNGNEHGATADVCPVITPVSAALNNFDDINDVFDGAPTIEDTPTGDSINAVVMSPDLLNHPSTDDDPIIFVLATDGEPDSCSNLDPAEGSQAQRDALDASVNAVASAFQKNIRTYVISVGNDIFPGHLQDVADAGLGRGPSDEPAQFWVAGDDDSLSDALREIVGGEVSCDVELSGSVQGSNPCLGSVELNGVAVTCNDPNGWELTDATHVRLVGSACEQFKTDLSATLDVSFPCGVKIIFPD